MLFFRKTGKRQQSQTYGSRFMLIWHYTSVDVLVELLKENSSLLATHISFLNDSKEGRFSSEHLIEYLYQQIAWDTGIDKTRISQLDKNVRNGLYRPRFVVCFSKLSDDLSQWRAYAPTGGVAIGFDIDEIKENLICPPKNTAKYDIRECIYLSDKDENLIMDKIKKSIDKFARRDVLKISDKSDIDSEDSLCHKINDQAFDALFVKHVSFGSEQEVRYGIMYDGFYHYQDIIVIKNRPRIPVALKTPARSLIKKIIISSHGNSEQKSLLVNILKNGSGLKFDIELGKISFIGS
jgi:hypothetical protein